MLQNKVSHTSVKWGEGQKLCDIRKREDEEDVRQAVYITSTELQPGLEPTEEASDSAVTQETPLALSVCLSHWPGLAPTKTATPLPFLRLPTLSFHPHSPFLHFLCDYSHHLAFLSSSGLPLSLSFFSYSPLWLHTSDPLNRFTHYILKVCLPPMISQSLSALLSTLGSDLPSLLSTSLLFSAPFLSPCRITLDIYSTAISLRRDENRFSLQQPLLSG